MSPIAWFLGGQDLEMRTIRQTLEQAGEAHIVDHHLPWGAATRHYCSELRAALAAGHIPALVELGLDDAVQSLRLVHARDIADITTLGPGHAVVIDHHGPLAGASVPTSLEQLFTLLGERAGPWTRWHALVAANDRGHLAELESMGATRDEMQQVRAADRAAQGVTADDEAAASAAIRGAERLGDGTLIVELPHARTSAVTDQLDHRLGGPGADRLVVISPDSVNVFADGGYIADLIARFPGGWYGGALPVRGFWGRSGDPDDVRSWVTSRPLGDTT